VEIVKNINWTVVAVAALIYNILLAAGSAYLCAVYEWSLWTMFFAFLCMVDVKETK
jgi:ABC-type glycerol-3-phosphate transport system permease component